MVNPITFYSRSADIPFSAEQKVRVEIPKPLTLKGRKPLAIFLGNPKQSFVEFGEGLGFYCVTYDGNSDPSHIVQAKVVIAQYMRHDFTGWIELIDLAVGYGIPTVWVHPILPPGRWMWSFRYCLVGLDVKPIDVWRKICQEVM